MVGDPMITAAGSAQRVPEGKLFEGSPKRHRIFRRGPLREARDAGWPILLSLGSMAFVCAAPVRVHVQHVLRITRNAKAEGRWDIPSGEVGIADS